jgi:hypothetical protein
MQGGVCVWRISVNGHGSYGCFVLLSLWPECRFSLAGQTKVKLGGHQSSVCAACSNSDSLHCLSTIDTKGGNHPPHITCVEIFSPAVQMSINPRIFEYSASFHLFFNPSLESRKHGKD